MDVHLCDADDQQKTFKKKEVGKSGRETKFNVGPDGKVTIRKGPSLEGRNQQKYSQVGMSNIRKKIDLSVAGAKWYLRYLKKCLKSDETFTDS